MSPKKHPDPKELTFELIWEGLALRARNMSKYLNQKPTKKRTNKSAAPGLWHRRGVQFLSGGMMGILGVFGIVFSVFFLKDIPYFYEIEFAGNRGLEAVILIEALISFGLLGSLGVHWAGTLVKPKSWLHTLMGGVWGALLAAVLFHLLQAGEHPLGVLLFLLPLIGAIWDFERSPRAD